MRRMLLVLWASALMVVVMGASALPAFAQVTHGSEEEPESGDVGEPGELGFMEGAGFVVPALLLGGGVLLRRNNRK